MKRHIKILIISVIVFFNTILTGSFLYALEGQLSYYSGTVSVQRGGKILIAEIDMPIYEGDIIKTSADTTAIISIKDGVDIKLRENTTLDMEDLSENMEVNLISGSIFSRIVKKFLNTYSVGAGTVLAGVRGTEFFIAYGKTIDKTPDVWLCVNDGSVEISVEGAGEKALVKEGEGINIIGGIRITDPKKYRWTKKLNWNTDPDTGSVIDNTDLNKAYSDLLDQDYD
jgi:ferric-dicitrate binding protein FerR (iron transport regulator)